MTSCSVYSAVILTPTATMNNGTYAYTYSVENASEVSVIGIQLILPVTPLSMSGPEGWVWNTASFGDAVMAQWFSTSTDFDVQPFASFGGFSIASTYGPAAVTFEAWDSNVESVTGVTEGPGLAPVPEPGTRWLIVVAAGAMLIAGRAFNRLHSARE